jgi:hypothetical protein
MRVASVPIPSTVTATSSPACSGPTPAGVPVRTTSPGSSVIVWLTHETQAATSRSMSAVVPSCFTSPLTVVRSDRAPGSISVSIHGPRGQESSKALARVHCFSARCMSRIVRSLPTV